MSTNQVMGVSGSSSRAASKPRITVIATGGTIASTKEDSEASTPSLQGEDLFRDFQGAVDFTFVNLLQKDSSCLTLRDMQAISSAAINAFVDEDICGVIVLHGTDSMEETSFLAQLQHSDHRPLVFTGSEFTADHPKSDGPANLQLAVDVILGWTQSGVLDAAYKNVKIAFHERIFSPRGTYKYSTDGRNIYETIEVNSPHLFLPADISEVRVETIYLSPGADAAIIDAAVSLGVHGIVLCCPGAGNSTAEVVSAIRKHSENGVPIVVSSRVPDGNLEPTYGGGGGGYDMVQAGAIYSHALRPSQSRVLLASLIAAKTPKIEIEKAFANESVRS